MYTISRGALLKKTILVLFAVAITLTLAFSGTGAVACAAETAETADSDFEVGIAFPSAKVTRSIR